MSFWIGFTIVFLSAALLASIHSFSKLPAKQSMNTKDAMSVAKSRSELAQKVLFALGLLGMGVLVYQWLSPHLSTGAVSMNFYLASLLIVWAASVLGLLLQLWRANQPLIFALIISCLLTLGLALLNLSSLHQVKNYDLITTVHAAFSFCGFGFLALAALQSICLKVSYYILKEKRGFTLLRHFPPIMQMERLLFVEILIGFCLLTLAFITGYFASADIFDNSVIHKTVLSLASWLMFGYLLLRHYSGRLGGQQAINYILIAYVLLAMAFLGSLFVRDIILT